MEPLKKSPMAPLVVLPGPMLSRKEGLGNTLAHILCTELSSLGQLRTYPSSNILLLCRFLALSSVDSREMPLGSLKKINSIFSRLS